MTGARMARGTAEGKAEGKAEGLLAILEVRGVAVSDARRAAVLACADMAQLDRWLRAAVTAASAGEVFGG